MVCGAGEKIVNFFNIKTEVEVEVEAKVEERFYNKNICLILETQ